MLEQKVLTRVDEVPMFFPAGDDQLFGVLSLPVEAARGIGVIVLSGGAFIAGTNRNRLSVRLARGLAARGFHVLRFDYHGVGESTGTINQYDLNRPFITDLEGAAAVMRTAGLRRLILVGSCFGARTILSTADRIPELAGAVLMSTPIQDFAMGDEVPLKVAGEKTLAELMRMAVRPKTLRSIFAPPTPEAGLRMRHVYKRTVAVKTRLMLQRLIGRRGPSDTPQGRRSPMSENFTKAFRSVVERGVTLFFLYGEEDAFYKEFSRVRSKSLRSLFERAYAPLDVGTVDGVLHGFSTLAVQDHAVERTVAWVDRAFPS